MRIVGGVLLAVWVAGDGRAMADEIPRLHVTWEAPQGCPDQDAFVGLIAGHLAGQAPAKPTHVEVVVAPTGRELALTLRTRTVDADGERVLHGKDCRLLADTAALTLALSIAPEAVKSAGGEPGRGLDDEVPPGGRRVDAPEVVAVEQPAESREWGLPTLIRAGMAGERGGLPGLASGVAGAVGVLSTGGLIRVEAQGSYWFARSATAHLDPQLTAELSAVAVGLRICLDFLRTRLELGACGGAELIRMKGVGSADTQTRLWVEHMGGPSLAWKITRSLLFRVDGEVIWRPWYRPLFTDMERDGVVIHKPDWVGLRAGLGLEAYFR